MLLIFAIVLTASILAPAYTITVLTVNTAVVIFLSFIQIAIALLPRFEPQRKKNVGRSFVSILVPAYNEPPALVMQTLESLASLDYENFEVLVIDNNTRDKNIWKPVDAFTRSLGNKFRF